MNFIVFAPEISSNEKIFHGCAVKLEFIMRASFIYLVLVIGSSQLLAARSGVAQPAEQRMTKVEMRNGDFKALIGKLKEQTLLSFVFPEEVVRYVSIDLPLAERTVKEVLDFVLSGTGLIYHFKDNTVFIYEIVGEGQDKERQNRTARNETLKRIHSAKITVHGRIIDGITQHPMAGVNVILKGTIDGTTSSTDGEYAIEVGENDILIFSFIGYKTQEVSVTGRAVIDIVMEADITSLQAVEVNAGYWNVADKEQTGNIARITADEIQRQPVTNPLAALQGRMPGVLIQQETGVPGSGFKVQIRGQNSLRDDGNDPLYVVDGVPFLSTPLSSGVSNGIIWNGTNPLNSINPADIQSIEILKDADATAIYGSRGANGVVLITTKKGFTGRTKFDVNFYNGAGRVTRTMDLLDTEQWVEMRKEAFKNSDLPMKTNDAFDLLEWDTTRYTDWQEQLIGGTARITNVHSSLAGGTENIQFFLGGGYYRETTVFPTNNGLQKASGNFSMNHISSNKRFTVFIKANYVFTSNNLPALDLTRLSQKLAPNAPAIFDEMGNLNWDNNRFDNPYAYLRKKYSGKTSNLISDLLLTYKVSQDLKLKTSLAFNTMQSKEIATDPISSQNPENSPTGTTSFGDNAVNTWIIEPQLEYQKTIKSIELSILVGTTFQQTIREDETMLGSGYSSDALLENIQLAPTLIPLRFNYTRYKYNAVFGRLNINWKGKYILNLTSRRDGSSRFGPERRFANFGAVGASWIFSSENFFVNGLPSLSFGKIRFSYGTTGNDQIGDYQYMDTYSGTPYPYQGMNGLVPTQLVNPNYAWETNRKLEGAFEGGLFNDRINFTFSWYLNRSSNQLVGYPLPLVTGFPTVQNNFPAIVQNTGYEVELNTTNIESGNFKWTTALNFTIPRNVLLQFPNLENSPYANTYKIGKSLFITNMYFYKGVDPNTGLYLIEDVDGNGTIGPPEDNRSQKEISQDFYGGFQNRLTFKNFQLDFFFQFVKQTGLNYLFSFSTSPGSRFSNQPSIVMRRWQKPGDITEIQQFRLSSVEFSNATFSDRTVGDASFLRLKNIELSWQIPSSWKQSIGAQEARIFFQGQNLLTVTNYLGLDPENQNVNSRLPPLKLLAAGIQLGF